MRSWGLLVLVLVACGGGAASPQTSHDAMVVDARPMDASDSDTGTPDDASDSDAVAADDADDEGDTIRIATFNIQLFGPSKSSKPEIMQQLGTIIRQYDVVTVQEIKDISGAAPLRLLEEVNSEGDREYAMLLSPRSGLQADDQTSQEQYAVLYDTAVVEALAGDRLFDDSDRDLFQREPYLTPLKTRNGNFTFVLIGIHTRPDSAVTEIGALHDVVEWGRTAFPVEDDFIVIGDFNAGCDYASPPRLDALALRGTDYFWIVPDDSDSNVSPNRPCPYDRIVTTANTQSEYAGHWGVDEAFTDNAVSDHWPVWAEFSSREALTQ